MIRPDDNAAAGRRLLLHCCCAPCSSAVLEQLTQRFQVDVYYYNPNIEPESEFRRRADEEIRFCGLYRPNDVHVIIAPYEHEAFAEIARGREDLPERGERCRLCYRLRMEKTAAYARGHGYDCFTTTLSVSPHKNAAWINEIGQELELAYGIPFVYSDFKKKNGYLRSIRMSEAYGLYRQDWCGCVYSRAERERQKAAKRAETAAHAE